MKKGLLVASLFGIFAVANAQAPQVLRVKVKAGQAFRYKMSMDNSSGGQSMKIGMQMTMKVAKVQNGQSTVNTTMGSITMNGQPIPASASDQIKNMLITTVIDARGNVLKTETKGLPGMAPGASQGSSVPFPAAAVKPGSTWSGQTEVQGQKVKTTYKLVQFKSVLGKQAAIIHATPTASPSFQTKGPIVFAVEVSNGFLLSMSMKGTAKQGTATQNMAVTMQRI